MWVSCCEKTTLLQLVSLHNLLMCIVRDVGGGGIGMSILFVGLLGRCDCLRRCCPSISVSKNEAFAKVLVDIAGDLA